METPIKALAEMFASKHEQARQNGATDEQAVQACRLLWLDAIGIKAEEVWA